jgi:RNA polymerase sigma-54 factor
MGMTGWRGDRLGADADPATVEVAIIIAQNLDDRGLLASSLTDLLDVVADMTGRPIDLAAAQAALRLAQRCEPAGLGARDMAEGLALQLAATAAAGDDVALDVLALRIVQEHYDQLLRYDWPGIARATRAAEADVREAVRRIGRCDPRPGSRFGSTVATGVRADLEVTTNVVGTPTVRLVNGNAPRLRIGRAYREIWAQRAGQDRAARAFMTERMGAARWMVEAVEHRQRTILAIGRALADAQWKFLQTGDWSEIRPLAMSEIGQQIGVHESTVSRAVAGKYVLTRWGMVPLRSLFSTAANDEGRLSSTSVRERVRLMIEAENAGEPLDDARIAQQLGLQGIAVWRRTVSKYRDGPAPAAGCCRMRAGHAFLTFLSLLITLAPSGHAQEHRPYS